MMKWWCKSWVKIIKKSVSDEKWDDKRRKYRNDSRGMTEIKTNFLFNFNQ